MFTASTTKICRNIAMEIQAHCFSSGFGAEEGYLCYFYRLFLEFGEGFGWFYSKSRCHVNTSNFSKTKMRVWF